MLTEKNIKIKSVDACHLDKWRKLHILVLLLTLER